MARMEGQKRTIIRTIRARIAAPNLVALNVIVGNLLEGVIAISAGLWAGSIALVVFGFDGLIEVTSGVALLWRLRADVDGARHERAETISLRIIAKEGIETLRDETCCDGTCQG